MSDLDHYLMRTVRCLRDGQVEMAKRNWRHVAAILADAGMHLPVTLAELAAELRAEVN